MPMDRSRYPENWEEISLSVKQQANWICQHCKRPCKRPDERWDEFLGRIVQLTQWAIDTDKLVRFVLTTAHLDQDPNNNDPSNLAALCSVCHLAHDRPFRQMNSQRKLERQGQLNLFFHQQERVETQPVYSSQFLEVM